MPMVVTGGGGSFPESVPVTVGMFRDVGGKLVWNGLEVDLRPGEPARELHRVTAGEITANRLSASSRAFSEAAYSSGSFAQITSCWTDPSSDTKAAGVPESVRTIRSR